MPAPIRPGVLLDTQRGLRLRVDAWQGEGSYARVYRATQLTGSIPAALKIAKKEIPEASERLAHEGQVLGAVRHPKLVQLLDSGCAFDSPFLILEWLDGDNLRDLVAKRRRLPLRQSLELFADACSATAAMHAAALIHGDIRPENLLVVPRRGAVLTDPGLPIDTKPEELSPAGDIAALGDLLHLMLTGRKAGSESASMNWAAGFSRTVVELWQSTRGSDVKAAQLAQSAERLRHAL